MNRIDRTPDGYFKVKAPDWNLISSIILDCIGPSRNISSFEKDCGFKPGMVSKILLKRRTEPMSAKKMSKILSKADRNCKVSLDGFAAANGLLSTEAVEKLLESLKPGYKDVPDYRFTEYKDAEFVKYPIPDVTDFRQFVKNLALFTENYPADPELILKADELFEDKVFVLGLEKWRCHFFAEKAQQAEKKHETNKSMPAVIPKTLSDKYGKVILKSLSTMGYLPAAG